MLSKSLRELQEDKLISRIQYNEVPPHVEYQITELGGTIQPILSMLCKWGAHVMQMGNMEGCSIKYALGLLSGKWKMRTVWEISQQKVIRFNDLQRRLDGISSLMLSKSLRELQENKLINRIQYNEVPPHVEYQITELGETIQPILSMLYKWGKVCDEFCVNNNSLRQDIR
jgi:DNA-binding HxlR family transcriptional regulator